MFDLPKIEFKIGYIQNIKKKTWNDLKSSLKVMQDKFYVYAIMVIYAKFKWMTEILILDYVVLFWVHFISESDI